jgi:hypothetical protein
VNRHLFRQVRNDLFGVQPAAQGDLQEDLDHRANRNRQDRTEDPADTSADQHGQNDREWRHTNRVAHHPRH